MGAADRQSHVSFRSATFRAITGDIKLYFRLSSRFLLTLRTGIRSAVDLAREGGESFAARYDTASKSNYVDFEGRSNA
jgi:hypothetical protein